MVMCFRSYYTLFLQLTANNLLGNPKPLFDNNVFYGGISRKQMDYDIYEVLTVSLPQAVTQAMEQACTLRIIPNRALNISRIHLSG
jgi:hypothetical protein